MKDQPTQPINFRMLKNNKEIGYFTKQIDQNNGKVVSINFTVDPSFADKTVTNVFNSVAQNFIENEGITIMSDYTNFYILYNGHKPRDASKVINLLIGILISMGAYNECYRPYIIGMCERMAEMIENNRNIIEVTNADSNTFDVDML